MLMPCCRPRWSLQSRSSRKLKHTIYSASAMQQLSSNRKTLPPMSRYGYTDSCIAPGPIVTNMSSAVVLMYITALACCVHSAYLGTSPAISHQPCCVQNAVESQHLELLSQSQADMSVSNNDEDEVERELRELNQTLVQMQQEVMSAQADCDRARSSEEEAQRNWEAKRSV